MVCCLLAILSIVFSVLCAILILFLKYMLPCQSSSKATSMKSFGDALPSCGPEIDVGTVQVDWGDAKVDNEWETVTTRPFPVQFHRPFSQIPHVFIIEGPYQSWNTVTGNGPFGGSTTIERRVTDLTSTGFSLSISADNYGKTMSANTYVWIAFNN